MRKILLGLLLGVVVSAGAVVSGLPTHKHQSVADGGTLAQPQITVLTTGSGLTYTTPAGAQRLEVRLVGGGAGSGQGAPTAAGQGSSGGGGGGGAYTEKLITSPAASYTYTVGAGGAAGAVGGATSFGTITAPGGSAGANGTASTAIGPDGGGGAGGVAGVNGDFMSVGADGGWGFQSAAAFAVGGYGAPSVLGGATIGVRTVTTLAGTAGKNYGGGASGGANSASQGTAAGAAGAGGLIIVKAYFH